MHMDDLWFDLVMREEPDLQDDVVKRFHLSDGREGDRAARSPDDVPPDDRPAGPRQASAADRH